MQRRNKIQLIKYYIRLVLLTLLAILILLNAFILLSGRTYIYTGIRHTYLKGRLGPSIYDINVFPHSTIQHAETEFIWKKSHFLNSQTIPEGFEALNQDLQSKAFIIIKDDSVLFEKYWDGHTDHTVSNSFSAAKTVVGLLIGIAIAEGKIGSIDDPVAYYIPEFNDGGKEDITIRHLLLMSSGLEWQESGKNPLSHNAESYFGNDLYGLVTRLRKVGEPGKEFIYQSGNSQLLGFVLKSATGKSVSQYLEEKIWKKIGASHDAYWSLDKENGDEKAFCCLYATPYDFAKIGRLILNNGNWDGEQIIPEEYMIAMKAPHHEMTTEEGVTNHQYGLHLWRYEGEDNPVDYCRGILGQYIITFPEENMILIRLGSKRMDNYPAPDDPIKRKEELSEIGHPMDFAKYIKFAHQIVDQTKHP